MGDEGVCLHVPVVNAERARTRAMLVADSAALQASAEAEGCMHLMSLSSGNAICRCHAAMLSPHRSSRQGVSCLLSPPQESHEGVSHSWDYYVTDFCMVPLLTLHV